MGAASSRSRLSGDGSRITLSNDIPGRNSADDTTTVYFTENAINLLNTSFGANNNNGPGSSAWSQQNSAQMNQVLFDRVTSIAYQQGLLDAEKVRWKQSRQRMKNLHACWYAVQFWVWIRQELELKKIFRVSGKALNVVRNCPAKNFDIYNLNLTPYNLERLPSKTAGWYGKWILILKFW